MIVKEVLMAEYILSLDIGTTGTRAFLYDRQCNVKASSYEVITQYYPQNGWVEQDAEEIYQKSINAVAAAMRSASIQPSEIAAIGIANQRETTVLWEKTNGHPVSKAIVWQDRRTLSLCERLYKEDGEDIMRRTGFILVPNAAATKLAWLLDNHEDLRVRAEKGELFYGTLDSYFVWRLTGGREHITDHSNNSVTLLQNAESLDYDRKLLKTLDIPPVLLPQIRQSSEVYAYTDPKEFFGRSVPIAGILGDQQAAAIGQGCLSAGIAKNTYGTGSFIVMNTGSQYIPPSDGLFSPVVFSRNGSVNYGLEGMSDVSAFVLQWLRDGLGIVNGPVEAESLARSVCDSAGVYFVPAFAGLGIPYFDSKARGTIIGLSHVTTKQHIARAAIEAMAFQVCDAFSALEKKTGIKLKALRADGGGSKSDLLMQCQADLLGVPVERPQNTEATSLGAAFMAGLAVSYWDSLEQIFDHVRTADIFEPSISQQQREFKLEQWHRAVSRAAKWLE